MACKRYISHQTEMGKNVLNWNRMHRTTNTYYWCRWGFRQNKSSGQHGKDLIFLKIQTQKKGFEHHFMPNHFQKDQSTKWCGWQGPFLSLLLASGWHYLEQFGTICRPCVAMIKYELVFFFSSFDFSNSIHKNIFFLTWGHSSSLLPLNLKQIKN